jgi:hypothetical protein
MDGTWYPPPITAGVCPLAIVGPARSASKIDLLCITQDDDHKASFVEGFLWAPPARKGHEMLFLRDP